MPAWLKTAFTIIIVFGVAFGASNLFHKDRIAELKRQLVEKHQAEEPYLFQTDTLGIKPEVITHGGKVRWGMARGFGRKFVVGPAYGEVLSARLDFYNLIDNIEEWGLRLESGRSYNYTVENRKFRLDVTILDPDSPLVLMQIWDVGFYEEPSEPPTP